MESLIYRCGIPHFAIDQRFHLAEAETGKWADAMGFIDLPCHYHPEASGPIKLWNGLGFGDTYIQEASGPTKLWNGLRFSDTYIQEVTAWKVLARFRMYMF